MAAKGLENVLWDAWRATKGNAEEMGTLFGSIRGLNAAVVLASDSGGKFKNMLVDMAKATGTLDAASQKMVDQFGDMNTKIKNNVDITLIKIGDRFMGTYGDIAGGLVDVFKGIRIGIDAGSFDPVFSFLNAQGGEIAVMLRKIAQSLPEAMADVDVTKLIRSLEGLGDTVKEAFEAIFGEIDLSTPEGLHKAIQRIVDGLAALTNMTRGVIEGMKPLFRLVGEGIDRFDELDESSADLIGRIMGVAKSINILAEYSGILTGALSLLALKGVGQLVVDMGKLGLKLVEIIPGLATLTGSLSTAGAIGLAGGVGVLTGSLLNQIPVVGEAAQSLLELIDVNGTFFGAQGRTKEEMEEVNRKFEEAVKKHQGLAEASRDTETAIFGMTGKMGDQRGVLVSAGDTIEDVTRKIKALTGDITAVPEKKDIGVSITADPGSIDKAHGMIVEKFPDGAQRLTQAVVKADEASIDAAKKKVESALPKEIEIRAKLDEARIKAQAETVQKAVEWTARVDIAEVEASTKKLEAMFKSIDNTISSTGSTMTSIIGSYTEILTSGRSGSYFLERQIEAENRRRDEALVSQMKLTEAQIRLMDARAKALESGQAMISVKGDGLQPHLEAFMWEILGAIQVRVNEDAGAFLLGIG